MSNLFQSVLLVVLLIGSFFGVYGFFTWYLGIELASILSILITFAPIWMPFLTFLLFHEFWISFVRQQFNAKNKRVTLEIFLPQEVFKSPAAMELMLNQLHQTAGIDNYVQSYWDGKHPPTFALELISTEGRVRFCINTQARFRNMIEAQLYAQYPGIEVRMLDIDYTAEIPEEGKGWFSFMFHFKLNKPDAYPIRTYIDYGLHDNPKEEEKVDPMSVTLESLGSLGPGEHMWLQILIKANKGYGFKEGSLSKSEDWKGGVKKEIEAVIEGAKKRAEDGGGTQQLTDGERDMIKSMERSLSKYAFDTYIRSVYIATPDTFDGGKIGLMPSIFRATDDVARNNIRPAWRTDTNWPWWQDFRGKTTERWRKVEIEDYKRRSYTEHGSGDTGMILTTEELATLFHIPGSVILTPNIQRISSQRSQAPSNLPV